MMSSLTAQLPHENEGGTDNFALPVTNGYISSHFEKEPNGFIVGGKDLIKMTGFAGYTKMKPEAVDGLPLPFSLLAGEVVVHTILCNEASVIVTNFRLFVCLPDSFHNIPVHTIEYVEMRELTMVHIVCKFGKVIRICLDTPEDCSELWRNITSSEASQLKTEDLFAFKYLKNLNILHKCNGVVQQTLSDPGDYEAAMFVNDLKRMEFNTQTIWRTSEINSKFEVCKTYPKFHIVPAFVTDEDLQVVADFRSMRRFPSVVWRNKSNGCVIARCSQPEVGWFGWRCEKDEHLLSAIAQAASLDSNGAASHLMSVSVTDIKPQPFLLVDARSYSAAVANRAKGGGCECQEYYPTCDIQFMGLVNIHAIRKSFQSVRSLSVNGMDQTNWYSTLEKTGWLHYLSALIRSTLIIVDAVNIEKRSAIVHCTDGWDRTTQLVSLAELLLDPYYRTIQGFCVLIEREWLEFGHKFADRCGHSADKNINEISPVFFQWLDAVHQIMKQFPSAFQFNESFLIKLVQHVYSCLFGTFLCNSIRERHQLKLKNKTVSIWTLLLSGKKEFRNILYVGEDKKVLYPSHHIRKMEFWDSVFIGDTEYPGDLFQSENAKPAEFCDSVTYTANLNGPSHNGLKYSISKNSYENLPSSNEGPSIIETNVPAIENSEREDKAFFSKCDQQQGHQSISDNVETNGIDGLQTNDHVKSHNKPANNNNNNLNSQFSNSDNYSHTHLNNCGNTDEPLSFIQQESLEDDDGDSTISESVNGISNSMTDSIRTLTGESSDRHSSYDDSCLHGKGFPEQELDPSLLSIEPRSNTMRKVLSSPDSPRAARLQRTQSFPDVMTASLCVETEIGKQYPSLECSKQINKDLIKDLSRYIDSDGLTIMHNYIDHKLLNIEQKHAQEIAKLQKRIQTERQAKISLQQQLQQLARKDGGEYSPVTFSDASQDDLLSLLDSCNGERSSVSSLSNDEGWEQVQFDDVQPTRWIPDHIQSNCSNCEQQFSIIIRRHHCRNCGGVFCAACSDHQISVPEEQLYEPVRVCSRCYESISHNET